MEEARELKLSQGDAAWGDEAFTNDEVTNLVNSGNLYVYRVEGNIAASVLLADSDQRMWGEEEGGDGTAVYIHRLYVGNDFRGQQVGSEVVDLAAEQARLRGKTKLRLDCLYDNPGLCKQYENMGFGEVRRFDRPRTAADRYPDGDPFRTVLYERVIAS